MCNIKYYLINFLQNKIFIINIFNYYSNYTRTRLKASCASYLLGDRNVSKECNFVDVMS